MPPTRFTPETRGALIERFAAGMSVAESCRAIELSEKTAKNWLARGRKEKSGAYTDFVQAVERARADAAARPEPLTEDEHRRLVADVCRKGSVAALKLAWEMILEDRKPAEEADQEADPLAEIDELAQRRANADRQTG